jgi:hypothetical protein
MRHWLGWNDGTKAFVRVLRYYFKEALNGLRTRKQ